MDNNKKTNWIVVTTSIFITISIVIISAICLIGMILCINSFVSNQQSFNDSYTDALNAIASNVQNNEPFDEKTVSSIITHMENLQVIQKNSVTNDLMSFIYGILSTILVGLCAGFVAKSKKNAEQAQNDAQKAESTKEIVLESKKDIESEVAKSKKLTENIKTQMDIQNCNTKILRIHIEIAHAKISLYLCNQVESNSRLFQIYKLISNLTDSSDKRTIEQLRDELLILKSSVDDFYNKANLEYSGGKQESMHIASSRYYEELNESIEICDRIISSKTDK